MKWKIHWSTEADEELADIWLNAPERDVISLASAQIERELAAKPANPAAQQPELFVVYPWLSILWCIRD